MLLKFVMNQQTVKPDITDNSCILKTYTDRTKYFTQEHAEIHTTVANSDDKTRPKVVKK